MNPPIPEVNKLLGYEAQAETLALYAELVGALHSEAVAHGQCAVASRLFAALRDFGESALAPLPGTTWASRQAKHAIARGNVDDARKFAAMAFASLLLAPVHLTPIDSTPMADIPYDSAAN